MCPLYTELKILNVLNKKTKIIGYRTYHVEVVQALRPSVSASSFGGKN